MFQIIEFSDHEVRLKFRFARKAYIDLCNQI